MHGDINGLHQTIQIMKKQLEDYNRQMEMQTQQIQDVGNEWEQLRIHLDFTKAQADALKGAYNDDVQQRIHQMLKTWHDVVVDCGENPKMLLAAAFVNASTNYAMAYKLVPKEQFNANAEAKQTTVEQIQEIVFSKRGYDRPGSGPYLLHSGPVSVNVYGDVRFEGSVAIPSSQSNQSCNSNSDDGLDG
ncbi:uncharacterized protein LOC128553916 isoform X2 [Mercenaria mercenaria]|uniref:uncharacterized protein LOC128553916 isoform X2 n=1 Tax=Mercenaria mercenaria TaxID=6596 RepID=UPI00234FAED1|nr:uncharacterized protein LOC128553916 isoform X2 [Mercenaria mercenaria]